MHTMHNTMHNIVYVIHNNNMLGWKNYEIQHIFQFAE